MRRYANVISGKIPCARASGCPVEFPVTPVLVGIPHGMGGWGGITVAGRVGIQANEVQDPMAGIQLSPTFFFFFSSPYSGVYKLSLPKADVETEKAALVVTSGAAAAPCGCKPGLQGTAPEKGVLLLRADGAEVVCIKGSCGTDLKDLSSCQFIL